MILSSENMDTINMAQRGYVTIITREERKRKIEERKRNFIDKYIKDGQLTNLEQLKDEYLGFSSDEINILELIKGLGVSMVPLCTCMNALDVYAEIEDPRQKQEILDNYSKEIVTAFIDHMEDKYTELDDPLIPVVLPYMSDEEIFEAFIGFSDNRQCQITVDDVISLLRKYPQIHDALMKYDYA